MNDPTIDLIARLPRATVAPDRARRTQDRCHRILGRGPRRAEAARPRPWPAWSGALVGLGAIYLAEAVRHALQAYGVR